MRPAAVFLAGRHTAGKAIWRAEREGGTLLVVEQQVATHEDVTTVMALLGDIREETRRIRWLLEDDDGEQEAEEDELDT